MATSNTVDVIDIDDDLIDLDQFPSLTVVDDITGLYDDSNDNKLTVDGEVSIKGTCVLKALQLQTLQIEALNDIIEEMLKEKRFDIEFDLKKRVDQKLFIQKLSSK